MLRGQLGLGAELCKSGRLKVVEPKRARAEGARNEVWEIFLPRLVVVICSEGTDGLQHTVVLSLDLLLQRAGGRVTRTSLIPDAMQRMS